MARSSLLVIFLVVFIDLVGFGIVIPILPYYAQSFGASAWELGWLMASYSLLQFLFSPVWGRVSDYIGRRTVLLGSIFGTALSLLVLAKADSLLWLFIGRIFAGFFSANISTAYAYVTDITSEENRAKGMGMIGAGFGLGFTFGPAIGGILSQYGYDVPMYFAAGLSALNLVFGYFKLKEPPLSPEVRASHRAKRFDVRVIRSVLADGRTRFAIGLFLLVTFAVTQMEVTFALYMKELYQYDAREAGMILGLMGIVMITVQGGLIGRLAKRFGETQLVVFGTGVAGIALAVFGSPVPFAVMVIALVFLALGHGLLHPCLSSIASFGANPSRRGATMGVFQSAGSLARVIGPPSAGWLYDRVSISAPFYCGALVLGIAFLISLGWWRRGTSLTSEV